MKKINILFWVFSLLLIPMFGIGSIIGLMGDPRSIEVIKSLGYPGYLLAFLCVARLLALFVIFLPGFSRLKEWAYAGLVFDVIGAIYSLGMVRHSIADTIIPSIALLLVFASYILSLKRHEPA